MNDLYIKIYIELYMYTENILYRGHRMSVNGYYTYDEMYVYLNSIHCSLYYYKHENDYIQWLYKYLTTLIIYKSKVKIHKTLDEYRYRFSLYDNNVTGTLYWIKDDILYYLGVVRNEGNVVYNFFDLFTGKPLLHTPIRNIQTLLAYKDKENIHICIGKDTCAKFLVQYMSINV